MTAFLLSTVAFSQSDSLSVPSGSQMTTDRLRNVFIITPTNDIIKYGPDGKRMAVANFKVLGNISGIDISNPFEIYIFYRDQNKVVFLDNLLNSKGEMDLDDLGVSQVACIGRSSDNNLWIFDMADLKLKKYGKDGRFMLESASFNTFLNTTISPTQIIDNNTSIFLLNSGSILEFDIFGNYNSTKLTDSISTFQYFNYQFIYLKKGKVYAYSPQRFNLKALDLQIPEKCKAVRFEKDFVYILTDEYLILQTYSFE